MTFAVYHEHADGTFAKVYLESCAEGLCPVVICGKCRRVTKKLAPGAACLDTACTCHGKGRLQARVLSGSN